MSEDSTSLPGATEVRLEALRGRVDAFERHLVASAVQSAQLVRFRLADLRDALRRLATAVHGDDEAAAAIRATADDLGRLLGTRVATGVGRLEAMRNRIAVAVAALHAELVEARARTGRRFDAATSVALRRFRHAHDGVDAELAIAVACRRLTAGLRGRRRDARRDEIAAELHTLRTQLEVRRGDLAAHRERSAALWRVLDAGLRDDVEQIGVALDGLLASATGAGETTLARSGKKRLDVSHRDVVRE